MTGCQRSKYVHLSWPRTITQKLRNRPTKYTETQKRNKNSKSKRKEQTV